MKKAFVIILAIIVVFFCFSAQGCANTEVFTAQSYTVDGKNIDNLIINVNNQEVFVSESIDDMIYIEYFKSDKTNFDINISQDNTLTMQIKTGVNSIINIKPPKENRKIIIKIPNTFLSNLKISTTNEKILVEPISIIDNIDFSCNGGNIQFNGIEAGKNVNLAVKNGSILGSINGSYDMFSIDCEVKKGECNIPLQKFDGVKHLKARCNNGNIAINFVASNKEIK